MSLRSLSAGYMRRITSKVPASVIVTLSIFPLMIQNPCQNVPLGYTYMMNESQDWRFFAFNVNVLNSTALSESSVP